jgi:hypothetical protein
VADTVRITPSRRTFSITCLTRSGRERAFCSAELLAKSVKARSVPAEMSDAAVCTRTPGPINCGGGTSMTLTTPLRTD